MGVSDTPPVEGAAHESADISALQMIMAEADKCVDDAEWRGYILWFSSIGLCLLIVMKIRSEEKQRFPDNLSTLYLFLTMALQVVMAFNLLFGDRQLEDDPATFWKVICTIQGFLFQFLVMALVLFWMVTIVAMFQVVVVQTPMDTMVVYGKYYHTASWATSTAFALGPLFAGAYGPLPFAFTCWIDDVLLRFICLYWIMGTASILGTVLVVKIVLTLARAGRVVSYERSSLLVEYIYRNLAMLLFMLFYFVITVIYAINSLIIEYWPEHLQYVVSTTYTYCMIWAVASSLIGFFIFLIWGTTQENFVKVKYYWHRMLTGMKITKCGPFHAERKRDPQTESDFLVGSVQGSQSFAPLESPRAVANAPTSTSESREADRNARPKSKGSLGPYCPSAFLEDGISTRSVPPDTEDRRLVDLMNRQYTLTVLNYARERLEGNDSNSVSDFSTSINESSTLFSVPERE